jgi:hypothetical protein
VGARPAKGPLSAVRRLDALLVRSRPTLFGYQHVLRMVPHAEEAIYADDIDLSDRADAPVDVALEVPAEHEVQSA